MKKIVAAALAATIALPGVAGAAGACYTPAAAEAEEGMRFLIEVMVSSTACRDQTYGLFQQRNKATVLLYQKTMISHLHGTTAFDRWDTSLANAAALRQAGKTGPQVCTEAAVILKQAAAMDDKAFRSYAAGQATAGASRYPKCR